MKFLSLLKVLNYLYLILLIMKGKGNLKYLSMKIDYNNYYSEREIANVFLNI